MPTPLLKLLIVDDESRFLDTIARRLRLRGFEVRTAASGAEAIALARKESFDLALLDLKMPGMDGGQVLRALREVDRFIEAIILTGHGSLQSAVELTELGAFCYLPKPYELDRLIKTLCRAQVTRLLRRHADDAELQERIRELAGEQDPLQALRRLSELQEGRSA